MNTKTRLIIGATIVAIGIGVISLGFIDQEGDVRYVNDIAERPEAHRSGSYTLLGMPQPSTFTTYGPDGEAVQPNPAYQPATQRVIRWSSQGVEHFSTLSLAVQGPVDGVSTWSLRNETRIPGGEALPTTWSNWTISRPHVIFQIQGFPDANGVQPVIWGIYEGVLRDPLQAKPSQFVGRVASTLPGGIPVPDGALVYQVDEYTAGCSSKFLPPDVQEEYKDDPDVV